MHLGTAYIFSLKFLLGLKFLPARKWVCVNCTLHVYFNTWNNFGKTRAAEIFAGDFLSDIAHGHACVRGNFVDTYLFIPGHFAHEFPLWLCQVVPPVWVEHAVFHSYWLNIQDSYQDNVFFYEVSWLNKVPLPWTPLPLHSILQAWSCTIYTVSLPRDDKLDITKCSINNNNQLTFHSTYYILGIGWTLYI